MKVVKQKIFVYDYISIACFDTQTLVDLILISLSSLKHFPSFILVILAEEAINGVFHLHLYKFLNHFKHVNSLWEEKRE